MRASPAAQQPAVQKVHETQAQSLGWEDALEEGLTAHSNILAWRIPWTVEPGRLYCPWACHITDTSEATEHAHTHIMLWGSYIYLNFVHPIDEYNVLIN